MESNYEFNVSIDYSDYGDKVYVVKYTDFPHIIGSGDTIEEAIVEAQGNLEVYFDYCKEKNIDSKEDSLLKQFKDMVFNAVPITIKIVEGARKEKALKEALIKFFIQEMSLYTDTDGFKVIATYIVYVEDLKNKYPNAKPLSEEEYNLIKEEVENYDYYKTNKRIRKRRNY